MGYSRSDTAHKWAHQLKERVAQSDNLWAEGTRLYSYRTVIGQIFFFKNGNRCYIIQNGHFSSSTSKHQGFMNSAIPGNYRKFPLYADRGTQWGWCGYGCAAKCNELTPEKDQLCFLFDQAIDMLQAIEEYKTDRTLNSEKQALVSHIWSNMVAFCELSGEVSISKVINTKNSDWRSESHNWYQDCKPERVKLMRKALRLLKSGAETPEVVDAICGTGTYQEYIDRTERIRKGLRTFYANADKHEKNYSRRSHLSYNEKLVDKVRDEQKRAEFLQRLNDRDMTVYRDLYHIGAINTIPSYIYGEDRDKVYRGGNVLMRLKGKTVETTKGMKVAIDECKRIWKLVCRWHENQSSFQVGEHALTIGYNNGWDIRAYFHDILHAGCHSIAYDEMRDLAVKLKLITA